jgi:adenine deaminase
MTAADFAIDAPQGADEVTVRAIEMVTDLVTAEKLITATVENGRLVCRPEEDLLKIAAVDRTHNPGKRFVGLIKGFGLNAGAVACSASWDSSDIIVVGANEADMAMAINRIEALQGGMVIAKKGGVLAELALPVFGLISEQPIDVIARQLEAIQQAAQDLGMSFPNPVLTLITLTGAAIPYLRICEEGLVNLKNGRTTGLFISA